MFALPAILDQLTQATPPPIDPTQPFYCPHTAQNCYYTTTMASDPHWSNVIIFIQADGLNNGALVNEISDPINNPLIVSGLSTSYLTNTRAKYGSKSAYFNGSNLLANIVPKVSGYSLIVNDFTFEFWAFVENATAGGTFGGLYNPVNNSSQTGLQVRFLPTTGRFQAVVGGNTISPTTVCPSGEWFHYAISRQGSSVRVFVNGDVNHSGTSSTAITLSNINVIRLGNGGGTTAWLNGNLDSIRFTNGVARYTANFNPETDTYLNTTVTKGSPVCSSFYVI